MSASAAPVGSLNADSAITVWATFGFSRERTNSGIRIAGSVGDSTAPTRNDDVPGEVEGEVRGHPHHRAR